MMLKFAMIPAIVLSLMACTMNQTKVEEMPSSQLIGVTKFDVNAEQGWYQVFAWYPASAKGDNAALPYAEKWLNKALAKQYGFPSFLMGGERASKAWQNAPILDGQFPVIIFNHGWQAFARSNMTQMEFLAEQGFIVMSINHPGDSLLIQKTDGIFVSQSESVQNSVKANKEDLDRIADHFSQLKSANSALAYHTQINALQQEPLYQPIANNFSTWVSQTQHLVAQVRNANASEPLAFFSGKIKSEKVGLMGHSFGGAVSGMLALLDTQTLPAVVLDAPQFNFGFTPTNTDAHILYLTGTDLKFGKTRVSNADLNQALVRDYPNVNEVNFKGAAHMNFTDLNHIAPLKWTGTLGPVNNKEFWHSMNDTILTFFDQQLR